MASQPGHPSAMLLPWPARLQAAAGDRKVSAQNLTPSYQGLQSPRIDQALRRIAGTIATRSGASDDTAAVPLAIQMQQLSPRYPGLEADESYLLEISPQGISIRAQTELGVLRAVATLAQLIDAGGELPCVHIEDQPRLAWRGLLLDCARHFLPVAAIERTLLAMASCKLNVLHLHLTDDQAYRLPSKAFPDLPSAEHYSSAELRNIVELAADLGIRVVPELDMPGHVTCWLTAYPQWGSQPVTATRRFGVHHACLDPTREEVFDAIGTLLAELAEIFPDPCLHIGGDEVHPAWWSQDPQIQAFMRKRSMVDHRDLQAYFNQRVGSLVEALGRQVVAWDEVAHEQLPAQWLVQAWRGATARDRLLAHGNRVIMSAPYYLDLHYPADVYYQFDPGAPQQQLVALEDAMLEDPRLQHVADGMRWTRQWRKDAVQLEDSSEHPGLIGAEACLWSELVDDRVLDQRLWSRLPALAERFWSEVDSATTQSLYQRMSHFQGHSLPSFGIDLAAQLHSALDDLSIHGRWQAIARLLEPVKWYGRLLGEEALAARLAGSEMPQARPYDADVPLTGLADALPPESLDWRAIDELIADAAGGPGADALRRLIAEWRDAAAEADPPDLLIAFLPALQALAEMIEQRLDGDAASPTALADLVRPHGELLLAVGPGLQNWLLNPS